MLNKCVNLDSETSIPNNHFVNNLTQVSSPTRRQNMQLSTNNDYSKECYVICYQHWSTG